MNANPFRHLLLLLLISLITSCASLVGSSNALADSSWRLDMLGSEPVIAEQAPTLNFSGDRVSGSAGCNSFQGEYSLSRDQITFNDLAMTLMACPDAEQVMEQERRYFTALQEVDKFELSESRLVLMNQQGTMLTFIRE